MIYISHPDKEKTKLLIGLVGDKVLKKNMEVSGMVEVTILDPEGYSYTDYCYPEIGAGFANVWGMQVIRKKYWRYR